MKKAVFSIFTMRTSGDYSWWDEFPIAIGERLKEQGIDHLYFYRDYARNSKCPAGKRYIISHNDIKNTRKVRQIIGPMLSRYDRVIIHHQTPSFESGLWPVSNKFNRNYHWVTTEHDSWYSTNFSSMKRIARSILRFFGFLPDVIVSTSKASKNRVTQLYGNKNIRLIYNGINIPGIAEPRKLKSAPNKALFVGRLEEYKGLWPLVKAIKKLNGENTIDLTIVGNGPLLEPMHNYIKSNRLEEKIRLTGHVHNISELMAKHHFAIIPSMHEENFPIASLEAQAHYLPCIYTNSGGIPEGHVNYKTGIMVPKDSPKDIVRAIQYFQEDVGRFNQIRLNARQNSLNFTMDKMAENYCKLYLELFEK